MIPQRTLTAQCEISTGSLTILQMPPMYTGEASALVVQVLLRNNGESYSPPSGVSADMYLYFPNTENMTHAYDMTISDNLLTGTLPASATGVDGYPLLIIQLTDTNTNSVIVAAHYQVRMIKARGKYIVSTEAPSPSEVVYVGRSPYIDHTNNHWMEWNTETRQYVDTGVELGTATKTYVDTELAKKVDKVAGKGLSTNDYDNTQKAEVAKVTNKADKAYVDDNLAMKANITTIQDMTQATADYHIGFYIDSDGDLCQN